ncbi:PREDICTED: uncharacterized protein LOC106107219 [Papilio polytes]|uniref:uncharacterized protein LOC106107219 n=1 Tax=Papilio polytes TaxID=76194 RepID=UPI000675FA2C|nr:PREDICTED: uncharacterized protein LOC106107219 [Papilio polytes]
MDIHTLFIADMGCKNVSTFLNKCEQAKYFRSPFRWIIFNNEDNKLNKQSSIIPIAINQIKIYPDTEVINVKKLQNDCYEIYLIYKVDDNSDWKSELYGVWKLKDRLQKSDKMIHSRSIRRLDLNTHEIKVAFVITNNDSLHHLTDGINDHIDTITKVNVLATNYLLDFLNASRKFVFVDTWGYPDNNTWNGMTGCLARGEVEIGGSPMFFTMARLPIVQFISSPVPSRSKFVFRQPKLSYENNLFLLPFRNSVWCSIGAVLFFLFLALFGVAFWEWKRNDHNIDSRISDAGTLRAKTSDIAILIFGATCQQGSPVELKGTLGRVVLLDLFLTVLFLHTSFSANIVALLQSSSSRIRTLEDLLQSRLKFGVHDNPFNRHYFATMAEPIRKAIYDTKIAPPGESPRFLSMEDGIQKIRQGLFAFHMETGVGYKFVEKYFEEGEKCGLYEIQYLQVADPWIAVRKNTPYLEMYKIGTKRIIEHGLQYRENRRLYERRPTCSGSDGNFVSVSMVDCYPAILVLSYGVLIAVFILLFELLYRYKHNIFKVIRRKK